MQAGEMNESVLKTKLCQGVEPLDSNDGFRKIEKVLAPFMRTLKRRKKFKTDVVADEYNDLYLKNSPTELLLRLQDSFTDPIRTTTLLNETGELLKVVTKSKCFNLYLPDYERGEIMLVSEYVAPNNRFEQRYPIESGTYLACHVAYTKEYVISNDILGDVRFPQGIPNAGFSLKAAICVPVVSNVQGNCIGIIELYRDQTGPPYDLVNLQICSALTAWLGIAVEQNTAKLNILKELEIHKQITQLTYLYFSRALSFGKVLSDILKILKAAVNAERGAFYVYEESVPLDSNETIFADAFEEGFTENDETVLFKKRTKLRFVKGEPGIPGYVARTGEILNIRDAYKDHRFDSKADSPFYRTRSILCFPIRGCHGVVAALKLTNRIHYPYFRKEDVDLLQPHLSAVGLVCQYYELDSSCNKLSLQLIEGSRLLDSETKPPSEEINYIKAFAQGDPLYPGGFFRFDWDTTSYEDDAVRYIATAIMNSEILEPCFDVHTLADFLLRVKKAHSSVPYHNFEHAFNVFHCLFLMTVKNKESFDAIELVSLCLAALCHDVDHSGFTNNFVKLRNDSISLLYEDYCGEIHRYEVAMFLIKASDVLVRFNSENFQVISKNLRRLMIGFDLSVHFQNRKEISEILNSDGFRWTYPEHRFYMHNMLLICADNCASFKSADIAKKIASNFYKELQHQGDLERAMEFELLPMMDRSKSDTIPECQITLLNVVLFPVIQIITIVFPNLSILNDLANQTLEKWKEIVAMRGQEMWKLNAALVKEKRKSHRVSVSRSSSIRTFMSER